MGIVAAIVGAAVATASAGAITIAGFSLGIFGSFLARAAIGIALNALSPKPRSAGTGAQSRGYQVNQRGSALDHQIIYGRVRVGGVVVFDGTTGQNNKFLHRVISYSGHEIESFDEIWINDAKVTILGVDGNVQQVELPDGTLSDRYDGFIRIKKHLGTDDQEADPDLVAEVPEWTVNHRLRGLSYLYFRVAFDQDKFPNGLPEFTATIKGKKVFDPRDDTTAWSDNPALCLRDYINEGYGLNEDVANIDDDLVSTAADVCDQTNTDAGTTRYTCNGAFTTNTTPFDLISDMLTSMGGLLWYAQGKWRMKPAYWVAPTVSFSEDDLRSSIAIQTRQSRRDNFNTVRGTFRGEESDWQVTDYPEVSSPSAIVADGGQESVADVELPFTDNSIEARRIARIALERNRQQLTVQASFGLRAFQVQVGDVIQLSIERFGWTNKEFEVVTWTFGLTEDMDIQAQMTLREISESVFDEVDDGAVYERDNTNLLSPFEVPSVGLSVDARAKTIREKLLNAIDINITSLGIERIDRVEVEYKSSSDTEWEKVGSGDIGRYEVLDVEPGPYDVRVRAINTFGVKGDWQSALNVNIDAFAGAPSDVTGFNYEVTGDTVNLFWDAVPDPDLSHYKIRFSPETSGATWAGATTAVEKVARPSVSVTLPVRSGTYMIRSIDKGGIPSEDFTSLVVTSDELPTFATTETQTEDPSFSGTKTNLIVDSSRLRLPLVASNLITNGTFDTDLSGWDTFGGVSQNSGVARFSLSPVVFDLGSLEQEISDRESTKTLVFDLVESTGTTNFFVTFTDSQNTNTPINVDGFSLGTNTLNFPSGYDTVRFNVSTSSVGVISIDNVVVGTSIEAGDTGTYEFSDVIDTGSSRRVWSYIHAPNVRVNDSLGLFDDVPGLFDSAIGLFDDFGSSGSLGDTNIKFFISTTEDDPTGTPTWSDWKQFRAGYFYGRAFRYKIEMETSSDQTTPSLTELDAIVQY